LSNQQSSTRERIIDQAVDLFNEQGIEGVGMRDIARSLNLSPGNLTYHFAKKEDVLVAVAERLSALNSRSHMAVGQPQSLTEFLGMFEQIFHNQFQFRCLPLSIVHLNEHYPAMAARYRGVQTMRTASFKEKLVHLRAHGYLREDVSSVEIDRMAAYCSLIGRFWLSEYWISYRERSIEEMIAHYLDLLGGVFLPYVSPKGFQDLTTSAAGYLSRSVPNR
jgi:AcrR family transcriptional regulator